MTETTFEKRCEILADLWLNYRDEDGFEDFMEYNDISLPLAYILHKELAEEMSNGITRDFIDETWSMLLSSLGLKDTGFDNLQSLFSSVK